MELMNGSMEVQLGKDMKVIMPNISNSIQNVIPVYQIIKLRMTHA